MDGFVLYTLVLFVGLVAISCIVSLCTECWSNKNPSRYRVVVALMGPGETDPAEWPPSAEG